MRGRNVKRMMGPIQQVRPQLPGLPASLLFRIAVLLLLNSSVPLPLEEFLPDEGPRRRAGAPRPREDVLSPGVRIIRLPVYQEGNHSSAESSRIAWTSVLRPGRSYWTTSQTTSRSMSTYSWAILFRMPIIACQGTWSCRFRNSSGSYRLASPMISSCRITAS